jgi:hypothetical protein
MDGRHGGREVIGIRKMLCGTANCAATLLVLGCYPRPHDFTRVPVVASTYHPQRFEAACDLFATHTVYLGNVSVPGNPAGACLNPEKSSP